MKARTQLEEEVRVHPDDMALLSDLGLIDAGLGRKEEALSEARRAMDLLPITKDAQAGAQMLTNLAITYAWAGEKDLALKQLKKLCGFRSGLLWPIAFASVLGSVARRSALRKNRRLSRAKETVSKSRLVFSR